jgi:RNA polymerase sigma-70 factor, ECF subfamily
VNLSDILPVTPGVDDDTGKQADEDEDRALMGRAREGDIDAFSTLFRRHRSRVERFIYRLSANRDSAEDGAQEVFLKLWLSRQRYRPEARFTTFLYRVARNHWIDQVRRARSRPSETELPTEAEFGVELLASRSAEPESQLLARYQQWRIHQAIARLPGGCRLVFVLVHLEGYRLAESADILEIPLGTVKSRMHQATRLLRAWLTPEMGEAIRPGPPDPKTGDENEM